MDNNNCWNTKKENIQYYNEIAKTYDLQYREEQTRKFKTILKLLYVLKSHRILDVGTGTGLLAEVAGFKKHIIGVDCSKNMLSKAKDKYGNQQDFLCADADHLPFADQTFDIIFSFTLLQNMPNPEKTIIEVRRVAKKNSKIILSAPKKAYSKRSFLRLFKNKEMVIIKFIDDEPQKDYVLVAKCS